MEQQLTVKEIIQYKAIEKLSGQIALLSVKLAEAEAKADLYLGTIQRMEQENQKDEN